MLVHLFASIYIHILSVMDRQSGYHILPPQDVFEPMIRDACSRLYQRAEGVMIIE